MKEKSGKWTTTESLTQMVWFESTSWMTTEDTNGNMLLEGLWEHTTISGKSEIPSYTFSTTLQNNEEICQRVQTEGDIGEGDEV